MKVAGVWVAAIALFIIYAGESADSADSTGLSVSGGVGYDFISQEYFLQTIADTSLDTLDVALDLTTNYLDDVRGQLGLQLRPFASTDFEWHTLFEQTEDAFRIRSTPEWSTRLGRSRLYLSSELDLKDQINVDDSTGFDAGYLYLNGTGRIMTPLSDRYNLHGRLYLTSVNFHNATSFNYDHRRAGLQAGVERLFDNFSSVRLDLFLAGRQVPDSSEIDYTSFGLNGTALWFHGGGSLDFWGRIERKDYDRPDGQSDFVRVETDIRNELRLGQNWKSRQELDFEVTSFTGSAGVNFDYSRTEVSGLIGRELGSLTLLAGPRFELLNEMPTEADLEEDYTEFGGQLNIDYFAVSRIFLSAQSQLGRRSWGSEFSLNSDFLFNRIYVLFDLTIIESLSFNSLLSAEWEWHDDPQDDSRLYLLSSMLTYEF